MSDLIEVILQRDAHRYWLSFMLVHNAAGIPVTRKMINDRLRSLKDGAPLDDLPEPGLQEWWDEENFRRYPFVEAVGLEIMGRLAAYSESHDLNHVRLDQQ